MPCRTFSCVFAQAARPYLLTFWPPEVKTGSKRMPIELSEDRILLPIHIAIAGVHPLFSDTLRCRYSFVKSKSIFFIVKPSSFTVFDG